MNSVSRDLRSSAEKATPDGAATTRYIKRLALIASAAVLTSLGGCSSPHPSPAWKELGAAADLSLMSDPAHCLWVVGLRSMRPVLSDKGGQVCGVLMPGGIGEAVAAQAPADKSREAK